MEPAAPYVRAYDDERIIVNMSVRHRHQWFEPLDGPAFALWWVLAGQFPDVKEGKRRLELLARVGPTSEAFTFKVQFPTLEHPSRCDHLGM
jgi:hypothetical protein